MCFFLNPEYKLLFVSGSLNFIQIISNLSIFNPLFDSTFIVVLLDLLSFFNIYVSNFFISFYSFCSLRLKHIFFLMREASEHTIFANELFLYCFNFFFFCVNYWISLFCNNYSFRASSCDVFILFWVDIHKILSHSISQSPL